MSNLLLLFSFSIVQNNTSMASHAIFSDFLKIPRSRNHEIKSTHNNSGLWRVLFADNLFQSSYTWRRLNTAVNQNHSHLGDINGRQKAAASGEQNALSWRVMLLMTAEYKKYLDFMWRRQWINPQVTPHSGIGAVQVIQVERDFQARVWPLCPAVSRIKRATWNRFWCKCFCFCQRHIRLFLIINYWLMMWHIFVFVMYFIKLQKLVFKIISWTDEYRSSSLFPEARLLRQWGQLIVNYLQAHQFF